jgi:hypothetical protein
MSDDIALKDKYTLARCCAPSPPEPIVGYYSHELHMKVHRPGCVNLKRVEPGRQIKQQWSEILSEAPTGPDSDISELDATDFAILQFHDEYGVDYSLKVARMLALEKQTVFDRHNKLRELELLQRVEPRMIQYRKGVVDNKWIKHRNHTYYALTDKGRSYLQHNSRGAR